MIFNFVSPESPAVFIERRHTSTPAQDDTTSFVATSFGRTASRTVVTALGRGNISARLDSRLISISLPTDFCPPTPISSTPPTTFRDDVTLSASFQAWGMSSQSPFRVPSQGKSDLSSSVPKFFRWLSERYPAISQLIAENRIPEFDCLYVRRFFPKPQGTLCPSLANTIPSWI